VSRRPEGRRERERKREPAKNPRIPAGSVFVSGQRSDQAWVSAGSGRISDLLLQIQPQRRHRLRVQILSSRSRRRLEREEEEREGEGEMRSRLEREIFFMKGERSI